MTGGDRQPLMPCLPPLALVDVRGGVVLYDKTKSASNRQEALAVVNVRPERPSLINIVHLEKALCSLT